MIMDLIDAGRVILFVGFLLATIYFFRLSWQTRNSHADDLVVQQHFLEHVIAASLAFMGSLIGVVYSIIHLLAKSQNHLVEYPFSLAMGLLLVSGLAFMLHMIKEQTPGHPYYIRENGDRNV